MSGVLVGEGNPLEEIPCRAPSRTVPPPTPPQGQRPNGGRRRRPRTLAALAAPRAPRLRLRTPADRVEVDLDRQVLHVVEDGVLIVGVRRAPLGTLYDPQYFHGGWAVHGSDRVPAVPASHGCVRVSRADAKAQLRLVGVGTTVHLHGGRHVFRPAT